MARFHGLIGFVEQSESAPGVWDTAAVTKRYYYGDIVKDHSFLVTSSNSTNDDIRVSNKLSVLSDNYMRTHLKSIRFAVMNGTPWRVTEIEVDDRRVLLTLGEVYNGVTN